MDANSFEEFVEMLGNTSDSLLDVVEFIEEKTEPSVRESPTQQVEEKISFTLKAAKCREDQYAPEFPPTMTCTPYKYDLKIFGTIRSKNEKKDLTVDLVDSETLEKPDYNSSETRPGVTLESVEVLSQRERVLRFALNWCSFHLRAFRLRVKSEQETIFISTPFHTYARRRDSPYTRETSVPLKKAATAVLSRPCSFSASLATSAGLYQNNVYWPSYPSPGQMTYSPAPVQPQQTVTKAALSSNTIHLHKLQPKQELPKSPVQYVSSSGASSPVQHLLTSMERTSLAVQLMSSLSPVERQAVNYYLQGL